MADGADTKTSQVNVDEFIEYFEPFLKEGKDLFNSSDNFLSESTSVTKKSPVVISQVVIPYL